MTLHDNMKLLEQRTRTVLPARSWVVVRVDGRAFHTWTRRLERPFDERMNDAMDAAALALTAEITGARVAYVQSDEISVIATDLVSDRSLHWFGGVVQKVASVAASVATAAFNQAVAPLQLPPATFDGRVFSTDDYDDIAAYLHWRHRDAARNAISMLAEHRLPSSTLHGMKTHERVDALAAAGLDLAELPAGFLHGRVVRRRTVCEPVTFTHKRTGETVHRPAVERTMWVVEPATGLDEPSGAASLLDELLPLSSAA